MQKEIPPTAGMPRIFYSLGQVPFSAVDGHSHREIAHRPRSCLRLGTARDEMGSRNQAFSVVTSFPTSARRGLWA